jgi:hypothetical protein
MNSLRIAMLSVARFLQFREQSLIAHPDHLSKRPHLPSTLYFKERSQFLQEPVQSAVLSPRKGSTKPVLPSGDAREYTFNPVSQLHGK